MHRQLADKAIRALSEIPEARKIILYGSVAREKYRPDSDIDIAFICCDKGKGGILDIEGLPYGLRQKIEEILNRLNNPNKIKFHVPIYWESEFKEGIELSSDEQGSRAPEILNKVGIVRYDALSDIA
ncbi:MAG: nucleotidyltransferase domain-containing protein [Candidatus Pacearchaeota archaeon]